MNRMPESTRKLVADRMRELADQVETGVMEPSIHYHGRESGAWTIDVWPYVTNTAQAKI